ncbi:5-oxoprolinase subunit PxpA [Mesonia aquimarina]|uniref:5-oxoprolinase subunit PxpA n=1 Tax=Mesonia aquimarina TaxID=1504967 RepID=UPI000EF5A84F|nr:5-oxoprolinase subunit PxpA [Mesonia aquimarina]
MTIDLNCDLAEGGKFDNQLMPLISSCNIACGGHFGNDKTVKEAIKLAITHQTNIGAHPSYPDQENFGRVSLDINTDELKSTLRTQILRVKSTAEEFGVKLHHIKPHGALYNDIIKDEEKAQLVIDVVHEIDENLILFVPPKSAVKKIAKGKLKTWTEGFADRNYEADFSLVSRKKEDAVLHEKGVIFKHVFFMISEGKIQLKNDKILMANFDTICVHSDTKNSVEILTFLREKLEENNVHIQ